MLHDIAPDAYDNDFYFLQPDQDDKVIFFRNKSALAYVQDGFLRAPSFSDLDIDPAIDLAGFDPSLGVDYHEVIVAYQDQHTDKGESPSVLIAHEDPFVKEGQDRPRVVRAHAKPIVREKVAERNNIEKPYRYQYLFSVGSDRYFFADLPSALIDRLLIKPGWEFVPLSGMQNYQPKAVRFALMVGYEYWTWYESARYCGHCGTPNVPDRKERMMRCPECGAMTFPKLFPAVIVGITRPDGKVLITRYAGRPYTNNALVAGFCEMGETVEQTVHREVMEEVGLRVKNLRYYKSQPWPDSSSLLFGFFCELDGSPEIDLDEHELSMAAWVDRDELYEDNDHSLTRAMMGVLRDRRETDYGIVAAS